MRLRRLSGLVLPHLVRPTGSRSCWFQKPPVRTVGIIYLVPTDPVLNRNRFRSYMPSSSLATTLLGRQWALDSRTLVLDYCVLEPEEGSVFPFWFNLLLPLHERVRSVSFC